MSLNEKLVAIAKEEGAVNAAIINVSEVKFLREFRDACAKNACGKFGSCWMCPPDVGDIDEMMARAKKYKKMFVFQTIGTLEDSFDIEGMQEAAKEHNDVAQALSVKVVPLLEKPLCLGAGACQVCDVCARVDNKPCIHPNTAIASLEAYGISVSDLATASGMKYINGENTVTYFGSFLYEPCE